MHDVVALLDGRHDLDQDFGLSRRAVNQYVAARISDLSEAQVQQALLNYLPPDSLVVQREARIRARLAWLEGLAEGPH
jgi:hypothetical protein